MPTYTATHDIMQVDFLENILIRGDPRITMSYIHYVRCSDNFCIAAINEYLTLFGPGFLGVVSAKGVGF